MTAKLIVILGFNSLLLTKTLLLSASILFSGFISAQNENSYTFSKRDAFGTQLESAFLSLADITETEKYDVPFYALDTEMTNQNTSIDGTGEIHGTSRVALDSVLFELFDEFTISEELDSGNLNYRKRYQLLPQGRFVRYTFLKLRDIYL